MTARAYVGGRVLIDRELRNATVVVDGSLIRDVLTDDRHVGNTETIDATGLIIAPGFIDTHVHGALGRNLMEASSDAVDSVGRYLVSQGVTSFVAATASVPLTSIEVSLAGLSSCSKRSGADNTAALLGVHLEGPFISAERRGVHRREYLLEPTDSNLSRVMDAADGALRICTIAPELTRGIPAIERLRADGVVPSIGHTDADYAATSRAIRAGARRATHLWNGMPPVHHRAPGPVAALLADDRVRAEVVADGIHISPEMLAAHFAVEPIAARMMLVSDGSDVTGLADGPQQRWEGTRVTLTNGVARNSAGTIAGSTSSVFDGVRTLAEAGVPLAYALYSASTVPAESLGYTRIGRLKVGAKADLVMLDDALSLRRVVLRGSEVNL
ncbi:N-acetylglucosamine-6-phosphate deacetylase [Paramicrobacterium agarici]|uniref:N-acetylglucosamine 6-phosphate deacetylase n=1 Tax=Paramicrobacterium agarici TaxID=630514 RepID=A0A2A9DXQ1_9MICO|nr:N-acetylglucosamine-6-phosphate deacetylase [Microbacterium agarici]PFG30699.1 N-acetylglucosamine 6-phosphate deacetylase [Microbacterium agarici]